MHNRRKHIYCMGGIAMEVIISDAAMNILRHNDLGRFIRIKPKSKHPDGVSYEIIQGELTLEDNYYEVAELVFIVSKEEQQLACLEIDYVEDWWGSELVIVLGGRS